MPKCQSKSIRVISVWSARRKGPGLKPILVIAAIRGPEGPRFHRFGVGVWRLERGIPEAAKALPRGNGVSYMNAKPGSARKRLRQVRGLRQGEECERAHASTVLRFALFAHPMRRASVAGASRGWAGETPAVRRLAPRTKNRRANFNLAPFRCPRRQKGKAALREMRRAGGFCGPMRNVPSH